MKIGWRRGLVVAVVIVVGVALWSSLRPTEVTVAHVKRGPLTAVFSATGIVEAYQAELAPEVIGRVTRIAADEGDAVNEGQVLAKIDPTQAEAALREREAAERAARAEVARIEAALQQERAASEARIAGAEARLEAARARLAELEAGARPQEIDAARQAVVSAQAETELAMADWERIRRLHEDGAVSRSEADRARTRVEQANAALKTAREELALVEEGARAEQISAARAEVGAATAELAAARAAAGQVAVLEQSARAAAAEVERANAAVRAASKTLLETEIRAPMDGRVARRYVDVGDLVGPSFPAFSIADTNNIWVTAEVDEEDIALVRKGDAVQVSAEALVDPVNGTIIEIAPAAISRGLEQVRAKIIRTKVRLDDNEHSDVLRPGMEVDVNGSVLLVEDALLIPLEALMERDDGPSVFVVRGGTARQTEVSTGRRTYEFVQVISGLEEGDMVVVSDKDDLKDGQRVRARAE